MTVPSSAASTFSDWLAAALLGQAESLATRWRERAAAAAPRPTSQDATTDAEAVVRALVASLEKDARWLGEVMRLGWQDGGTAHRAGLAPHHVLTDADLLVAVVLAAAEQCAAPASGAGASGEGVGVATAADGIAAARRIQRAGALYGHAAAASFLHATVAAVRAHYRLLRHDLRNPIGTIRGALSLMEDETIPVESRLGPNVRAMVVRNAVSLDRLIAAGLDDVAAEALLTAPQEVSLRDLALATRRALREPARLAECAIVVGDDLPSARVDAAAVELTLSAILLAGLAEAGAGDVLRVDAARAEPADGRGESAAPRAADSVLLRLVHERARRADLPEHGAGGAPPVPGEPAGAFASWDRHGLELAASVAAEFGGRIGMTPATDGSRHAGRHRFRRTARPTDAAPLVDAPALFVELPILPGPADAGLADASPPGAHAPAHAPAHAAARDRAVPPPSARHPRDDLARAD